MQGLYSQRMRAMSMTTLRNAMPEQSELNDLITSFDAAVWAKRFVEVARNNPDIPTDEETMIAWFSNAIMTGYDAGAKEALPSQSGSPQSFLAEKTKLIRKVDNCNRVTRLALQSACVSGTTEVVSELTESIKCLDRAWRSLNQEITDYWNITSTPRQAKQEDVESIINKIKKQN